MPESKRGVDPVEELKVACLLAKRPGVWAHAHEFSAQYICDVLHRRTRPGRPLLAALGLERVRRVTITYHRVGVPHPDVLELRRKLRRARVGATASVPVLVPPPLEPLAPSPAPAPAPAPPAETVFDLLCRVGAFSKPQAGG